MNLLDLMVRLHDSEINSGLQLMYDGNLEVWLGDGYNGILVSSWFNSRDPAKAAAWLAGEVIKHFPDSPFARAAQKR